MAVHRRKIVSIIVFTLGVLGTTMASAPADHAGNRHEVARLRAHFDTVLRELRAADVSSLTAGQRTARATLVARLQQYAAAGRFPHNHVRPDARVPVFRDEHKTLCAMGYLIASTGRTDIVDDVANTNNLALIHELEGDPSLRAWLDSTGLTLAEAARIQPAYEGDLCACIVLPTERSGTSTRVRAYATRSAVATMAGATSMFLNAAADDTRPSLARRSAILGLAAGASQALYGGLALPLSDSRRTIGVANVSIGGVSIAAAIWRMRHPPGPPRKETTVALQPYATSAGTAGVLLSARM